MRQVEQEEEAIAAGDPEGLQLHLCIINLVIGTLYCSKVSWLQMQGSYNNSTCVRFINTCICVAHTMPIQSGIVVRGSQIAHSGSS